MFLNPQRVDFCEQNNWRGVVSKAVVIKLNSVLVTVSGLTDTWSKAV